MSRITHFFLSLSLILAAPGLAPYQAAAQTLSAARVIVPVGSLGRLPMNFGSGTSSPFGSVGVSQGLQAGLIPSLSPSAALTPVLSAPVSAAASIAAPSALKPVAVQAAASPEKLAAHDQALAVLQTGTNALAAASKTGAEAAPQVALDGLFEGSISRPETLAVVGRSAAADSPRLDPAASRDAAQGPRWVKTFRGPNAAPATSVKRTLSVGFLAAVIPITITMVAVVVAQLLGYELHPNYRGPDAGATPTILAALALWIGAAVMAPLSEEAIFRGGLQGRLAKLSAKLHLGSFVVPAAITSLIFAAIHETSDPVLFATRVVQAIILSYVYKKEGILASMAAHGFFNGLLALTVVFAALGLPWLALAAVPAAIYFAVKSAKTIRAQKPDIASGALTPKPLSAALAFLFAGLLMLGYLFIMPNIIWPIGALVLLAAGARILSKKS